MAVRVSELSRASGVPVPTVKYYLREGLLPPGEPTAPNQADYSEEHVHRLRLVRVLREVGGLGIEQVRNVVAAIDDERVPVHRLLGVAHHALSPARAEGPLADDVEQARAEVDTFLAGLGWQVSASAPARHALADALVALRRLGRDVGTEVFEPYAQAADRIAEREVARVPAERGRAGSVEQVVVGTVVFEAVLAALRRLAQEHHSSLRFGRGRGGRGGR